MSRRSSSGDQGRGAYLRSRDRRLFMRSVGAGFAALPFFKVVEDSFAKATGAQLPLRFVTLYHPHGISAELFVMQQGESETSYDLKFTDSVLSPFDDAATYGKSFKDKVLPIEGLDLLSSANGHDTAGTILTGSRIDASAAKPLNSSLDQYLAVEKNLGADTPVTSISLGVGNDGTKSGETLSFGPGGLPLPKIIDPVQAFNTLFANFVVPQDPAAQAAAERERKIGGSILDFVKGDIGRMRARLATPEQNKLDQHLTSLRDLEKQIMGTMTGVVCNTPSKPDATKFPNLKAYNGGEPYFDAITNAFIDLIANAFACDVTRFVTLYMADLSYNGNPLNLPADNHGAVAHTYVGTTVGQDGHPVTEPTDSATIASNKATRALLGKFNRYAYGKVALLMQKLDQLGVLDHTLIYSSSDMGNPALHSTRNVPTVLAGGVNGLFRMGRRLKTAADCPSSNVWCAPGDTSFQGVSNNHLLVSIANAFGVNITSYGTQPDTKMTTGALANLT